MERSVKRINLLLICVTLCLSSFSALSKNSLTLYGLIDSGVEYLSGVSGSSRLRMPAITGSFPSRWGLRGAEDLGGGYQAVFTAESGFNANNGTSGQGSRLFGRQVWVGIKSPYGTLSLGRQYSMTYISLLDGDVMGPSIYSLGSLSPNIPNDRVDNTISYFGKFDTWTVGATYSLGGRDSAGTGNTPGQGTCAGAETDDFHRCQEWSALLRYDTEWFGGGASYEQQRGGPGAAANFFDGVAPTPFTSSSDKDRLIQLNGWINVYGFKITTGWLGRRMTSDSAGGVEVRSNIYYLTARYQFTPAFAVDGGAYRIINSDHDTRATLSTLRATYEFSTRSAVYAQLGHIANSSAANYSLSSGGPAPPGKGASQTGVVIGMRHVF